MMTTIRCVTGIMVSICMLAVSFSAAMAKDKKENMNYGQVKLSVFQPIHDLDDAGYDLGFGMSFGYGRYLDENLIIEAGFDFFNTDNELNGTNATAGSYTQDNDLSVSALRVTLKGEIPVTPLEIYGGLGFAIYGISLKSEIDSSTLGSFYKDETDAVLGGHLIVGAKYKINKIFYAGVEGLYRYTDDVDINERVAGIPVEYRGDLNSLSIAVTAGIRF